MSKSFINLFIKPSFAAGSESGFRPDYNFVNSSAKNIKISQLVLSGIEEPFLFVLFDHDVL